MRKIADSSKPSCSVLLSARAEARSRPNGFSTTSRAPLAQPDLARPVDHRPEDAGRDRQVVRGVGGLAELAPQGLEGGGVAVVAAHVAEAAEQLADHRLVERLDVLLQAVAGARLKLLQRPGRVRHADDRHLEVPAPGHADRARERSSCRRDLRWRRRKRTRPSELPSCGGSIERTRRRGTTKETGDECDGRRDFRSRSVRPPRRRPPGRPSIRRPSRRPPGRRRARTGAGGGRRRGSTGRGAGARTKSSAVQRSTVAGVGSLARSISTTVAYGLTSSSKRGSAVR